MISHTNNSAINAAYQTQTKSNEARGTKQSLESSTPTNSRLEQLKESINNGEYKVDIEAVSEKIAESLL